MGSARPWGRPNSGQGGEAGPAIRGAAMERYDLIVIGSGPAGRRAAHPGGQARQARAGRRERGRRVGGVSVHTGTIPSKTLRETVLNLSGWRERGFYGRAYRVKKDIERGGPAPPPAHHARPRGRGAGAPVRPQRRRHRRAAPPASLDPHRVEVERRRAASADLHRRALRDRRRHRALSPGHIAFDGENIVDSDEILDLDRASRAAWRWSAPA